MKFGFINTTDKDVAKQLQEMGLKLLSEDSGVFTFVNINGLKKVNFDNIDKGKIHFTNKINI